MKKTLLAILTMAAAISASAVQVELLKNGDGSSLDGWEHPGTPNVSAFAIQTIDGVGWFASSYSECLLSQTVTLSDYGVTASDIQNGLDVTAFGMVWAPTEKEGNGSRICRVKVYELDADGEQLQEHPRGRVGDGRWCSCPQSPDTAPPRHSRTER